ncbi:MAG: hypothetical protein H6Q05_1088 [Acidobacteria bacterium]|nr:hypothetical protein [Acidobacteriota bacterium]
MPMHRSPSIRELPFSRIPHQPAIFLKYLEGSAEVMRFYRHPPTLEALAREANAIARTSFPRREMAEVASGQNQTFGSTAPVWQRIEDLAKPDSVAVVTGQQAGLFTGPMLTICKALTALRLSEELRRSGHNAVAIFWIASDDHDLAEITRLVLPGAEDGPRVLDARETLFGQAELPGSPVGCLRLPESIRALVEAYVGSFARSAQSDTIRVQLAAAYQPGATFTEAFGRLMARLFRDHGLILFDPRHEGAKRLAAPLIRKALLSAHELRAQLTDQILALHAMGLREQVAVPPHSTLVFYEEEGQRKLVLARDQEFALKNSRSRFTSEQLSGLTASAPERFSPNALLRPVLQDHLFPTAAYVGGPAEISYFAQAGPIYRYFRRSMPVVWPRSSFTVLGPETCEILKRHSLAPEDCYGGERTLIRRMLRAHSDRSGILLEELETRIERTMPELKAALAAAESSLGPATETIGRKLEFRLDSLRRGFEGFRVRNDKRLRKDLSDLQSNCFPNDNLQERELGVHPMIARLGPSLLAAMYASIDLQAFKHRILCFEDD